MKLAVLTVPALETFYVECPGHYTVGELKEVIMEIHGLSTDEQRFAYRGRFLEDNRELKSYGIGDGSRLFLPCRDRGEIPPVLRKLYMNGILLSDQEDSIARYRIFGTVLTYLAKKTSMMVYIDSFTGKTFSLECSDQHTEEELREMIQDSEGIPKDEQRLMFAGKHLEDKRRLKDCHITKGSTIQMTLRLRGG
ncbi:MAG: ubiquitin-related domain-containing protein, partial [Benniella sp.]